MFKLSCNIVLKLILVFLISNCKSQLSNDTTPEELDYLFTESTFTEFTVLIPINYMECFWYHPRANFIIEYMVLNGGARDIVLFIQDPTDNSIYPPGNHRYIDVIVRPELRLVGYRICFDNRGMSWAPKKVIFKIDAKIIFENDGTYGFLGRPLTEVHRAIRYVREGLFRQHANGFIDFLMQQKIIRSINVWFIAHLFLIITCAGLQSWYVKRMLRQ